MNSMSKMDMKMSDPEFMSQFQSETADLLMKFAEASVGLDIMVAAHASLAHFDCICASLGKKEGEAVRKIITNFVATKRSEIDSDIGH